MLNLDLTFIQYEKESGGIVRYFLVNSGLAVMILWPLKLRITKESLSEEDITGFC